MVNVEAILDFLSECDFDGELTEDDFYEKVIDRLPKNVSFEYHSGATKVVILFPGAEYVIKIPFNGAWEFNEYGDEELFCEFENGSELTSWDYCQGEVEEYSRAESYEIESFFAKIEYIGDVNGHPIYIQERAEILDQMYKCYSKEKQTPAHTKCNNKSFKWFNSTWIVDLFDYCDDSMFDAVMSFATEYLCDLHSGNVGYINGKPVLVDYAGFND